ncbi:alpha-L-arabinofuranosidase [Rathayibacter sp. PhB93]|uniref:alpha-L-arabinofuranosidase C-terminal domain-containing protein n=1 Tax=unclassified Rathayibacter TaxID=2609250 RepID=UPI000F473099|nr:MULTISPECIES: alpha-L-arabinofuranosidase C-terminal domain-containing protein [unclassified Rathayibacter]ROQ00943.1 alpha-L-arabinofuranosidase [Rathayibacter sp. PhB93]TDQ07297.1 alpha-L-arabinofuranosidase [Rathayibacter sp. PhB1]
MTDTTAPSTPTTDTETALLRLRTGTPTTPISPTLYGLFLEDINFGCDGGLSANLVNNHSFEGVYLTNGTLPYAPLDLIPDGARERFAAMAPEDLPLQATTPAGRHLDRLRHWRVTGGRLESARNGAASPGASFARLRLDEETGTLENQGYPGELPGMAFDPERPMLLSLLLRTDAFDGALEARLVGADGTVLASGALQHTAGGWQECRVRLVPTATALGSLQIVATGAGAIDLDEVRLVHEDHWGAGDPRWSQGLLRRDLVEALGALAPRFLRFPGGCIVEGCGDGSHYDWKKTVGPVLTRRAEYNMWGQSRADGDYSQSNQIGFYEYFLLCEDLGMAPIPVVWAGDSCQTRQDEHLPLESAEFAAVIQDTLDLIEWATGDATTNHWAALRAAAGHPEPFPLQHLGIGNENFGPEYLAHFARIRDAVDRAHPGLTVIVNGGVIRPGETADPAWEIYGEDENVLVDEHFYNSPAWVFNATERYDSYPRGGARLFLGEYAAYLGYDLGDRHPTVPESMLAPEPNTWLSALAEAAFLTGVERNSDVVAFSCYAPLLNLVEHGQWPHCLIDFSPSRVVRTANYLVQQLFATRIGEHVVPIDGALPEGVFASASRGDGVLHLKLVAIGAEPVALTLAIDKARDGSVPATVIGAPLEAVNRLAFDGEPRMEVEPRTVDVDVRGGSVDLILEPTSVLAVSFPVVAAQDIR